MTPPLRVAIQGVRASFHDMAARKYFKQQELQLVECSTFRQLFQYLHSGEVDFAVMAIENSVAGSLLTNYMLMEQFKTKIVGEVYQRIELNLMALKGQSLEDIRYVQSHPMALLQCDVFLDGLGQVKIIEAHDTAESAKEIMEKGTLGISCIAGRLAAEEYGLEILASGIETNHQNYTRFLVLSRGPKPQIHEQPEVTDKASLRFETSHAPGRLVAVLKIFEEHGINMTKLQSVPILGRPYHYGFHVDLEWQDERKYRASLEAMKKESLNVIHFGEYKKDERPGL